MIMSKAIFKFNSGNLALLCSNCSVIIKEGCEFTNKEMNACLGKVKLKAQYCEKCQSIINNKFTK